MTQQDFGTINPNTKSGTELAEDLNQFRDTVYSIHSGSTRPSYAVPNMLWIQEAGDFRRLFLYDGTEDIILMTINSVDNIVFNPVSQNRRSAVYFNGEVLFFQFTNAFVAGSTPQNKLTMREDRMRMSQDWTLLIDQTFTIQGRMQFDNNPVYTVIPATGSIITIDLDGPRFLQRVVNTNLRIIAPISSIYSGYVELLLTNDGTANRSVAVQNFNNVIGTHNGAAGASNLYRITHMTNYTQLEILN